MMKVLYSEKALILMLLIHLFHSDTLEPETRDSVRSKQHSFNYSFQDDVLSLIVVIRS
jgi:hypothetical protein